VKVVHRHAQTVQGLGEIIAETSIRTIVTGAAAVRPWSWILRDYLPVLEHLLAHCAGITPDIAA
jgi:hypothetical protein